MMTKDFVLEIGVENLPASYIAPAFEQLRADAAAMFGELRLETGRVRATGTPRRLVLFVDELADRQTASVETVTGPPVERAFDENGKPTRAAEGFARSLGVDVDKLDHVKKDKGEFLGLERRLPRRPASTLLSERLPGLIGGLRFPKTMKWEASGARFARPVRWIVALYGDKVVKFRFADVTSGNMTFARPWMRGESAVVGNASNYLPAMKKLRVIVEHDARRDRIYSLAGKAAARESLRLVGDEDLLTEISFMTEDPRVLLGSYETSYLELPAEVVTTAMRSHQRYFALDDGKRLVSRFITFTDGPVKGPAEVRHGNEKVLRARLEDAKFYWDEDLRRGIDGLADELDRIVFVEGLGTLGEKHRRMEKLALQFNGSFRSPASTAEVSRACRLAKADVASEMVKDGKEFTKLQGLIGAHYAAKSGEAKTVVEAIREHYAPRTAKDPVPPSTVARIVGVADRVDTIVGCFLVGLVPSGSQDPYALRRQANGLIRILENEPGVALDALIDASLVLYRETVDLDAEKARAGLVEFLRARSETFLRDRGIDYDVANAVIAVAWTRPSVALSQAEAIAGLRGDAVFERLVTGVKRVGNILDDRHRQFGMPWAQIKSAVRGHTFGGNLKFDGALFTDNAEKALEDAVRRHLDKIAEFESQQDFSGVLRVLSSLADPIDAYFDAVLVNAKDATIRQNRHAFLAVVFSVFARYADFSCIVERADA